MLQRYRKLIYWSLGLLCALALVSAGMFLLSRRAEDTRVIFLDIGQGDATLISEGSNQILIDGGPNGTLLLERLGAHMPFWDRTIETVIATHPDEDHINGLVDVMDQYNVEHMIMTGAQKDSKTFSALMESLAHYNVDVINAFFGHTITFPSGAEYRIVYPFDRVAADATGDWNAMSVSGVFTTGNEKFFLGGDLPSEQEELLPLSDEITVLKASHHGSKSSTSNFFLSQIVPRDTVISAGKDNRYSHPAQEVLDRLNAANIKILRTDEMGTIQYICPQDQDSCEIKVDRMQ